MAKAMANKLQTVTNVIVCVEWYDKIKNMELMKKTTNCTESRGEGTKLVLYRAHIEKMCQ